MVLVAILSRSILSSVNKKTWQKARNASCVCTPINFSSDKIPRVKFYVSCESHVKASVQCIYVHRVIVSSSLHATTTSATELLRFVFQYFLYMMWVGTMNSYSGILILLKLLAGLRFGFISIIFGLIWRLFGWTTPAILHGTMYKFTYMVV